MMTEKMQNSEIVGRDIASPVDEMELGGQRYRLVHDLTSFRVAEDVYELHYGRLVNFAVILQHMAAGRIGAIMAVLYGALVAGGLEITWEKFFQDFRLTDIPGFKEQLMENIKKAMPEVTPQDKAAGAPQ